MRDLAKDLEICKRAAPGPWRLLSEDPIANTVVVAGRTGFERYIAAANTSHHPAKICIANATFIAEAREGWPEAIQRAIAAEAQVRKLLDAPDGLKEFVKANNELWDELKVAQTRVKELEAQAAAMRKVLELLRDSPDCGRDFCSLIAGDDALVDEALYPDAGRDLLERVKKLEAVAEAITDEDRLREFVDRVTRYPAEPLLNLLRHCFPEIEVLEGGEQDG